MQLTGVVEPVLWVNGAQAGLLINGIKLMLGLKTQDVSLNDRCLETLGSQQHLSFFHGGGCVIDARDVKAAPGQLRDFPAAAVEKTQMLLAAKGLKASVIQ